MVTASRSPVAGSNLGPGPGPHWAVNLIKSRRSLNSLWSDLKEEPLDMKSVVFIQRKC